MRDTEQLKQTDNPTTYKRLRWSLLFKEKGGCCTDCPLKSPKKKDLKSWKTSRRTQYHTIEY